MADPPAYSAARLFGERRQHLSGGWWMLLPAVLFLVFIFLVPVARLLSLSVMEQNHLTFGHYARLLDSQLYFQVLAGTFRIALWTTLVCLLAGYPVAYLLATVQRTKRHLLLICVLLPFWTSVLVRTLAWILILGHKGALNSALVAVGLTNEPLELLYNFASVIVGMSHAMMPLAILTMYSVMDNIEPNLSRAASTLGARGAQTFWRIYFPLSLPGVAAGGLLVFITSLGFFVTSALLGSPKEVMLAQIIIMHADEMLDWGFAGAVSMLLVVAAIIVFWLFDRVLGAAALTGELKVTGTGKQQGFLASCGVWLGNRVVSFLGSAGAWLGESWDRILRQSNRSVSRSHRRVGLWVTGATVLIFLTAPSFFLVPLAFSTNPFFGWPPHGFSLQWFEAYFTSPVWQSATVRSVLIGLCTASLSMVLGVPAAFALSRSSRIPVKGAFLAFMLLPIVLPHIIVALGLYYILARIGLVGTAAGLIMGHTIFALPYVVVTIMAVLRNYDIRLDQAAWTLGGGHLVTFWKITLPLIKAGLMTAFLFAFVKSFDELTVALFISGGTSTTLPRQLWSDMLLNINPTLAAVSTVILILVTVVILVGEALNPRERVIQH